MDKSQENIERLMTEGIVFRPARSNSNSSQKNDKVKTKAKKKSYITGQHGSGSAKKKADIRQRRANRHKK